MGRRLRLYALSSLFLVLPLAARAQFPAVPPTPPIPADQLYQLYYPRSHDAKVATPSDIVMYEGYADTIVFKMLNLTPYWMELADASQALLTEHRSRTRLQPEHFMFAPVGLPNLIPPGSRYDYATGEYVGRTTPNVHPRTFVLSWEPWFLVPKTHLNWVVRDVDYIWCANEYDASTCGSYTNDQYLGVWVTYESPPDPLESGSFEFMLSVCEEEIALLGLLMDPLNPVAWIAFGFTTKGVIEDSVEFAAEQKHADKGPGKVYVSAYTIPDWNRDCFTMNNLDTWLQTGHSGEPSHYQNCVPSTKSELTEDSDAYDAAWSPYIAGSGPGALVVLAIGLRGQTPTSSGRNGPSTLGSLPMVSLVVMTGKQYERAYQGALQSSLLKQSPPMVTAQPGPLDLDDVKVVREARKLRDRYGLDEGRRALANTVASLDPEAQQVFYDAAFTLLDRHPISKEQEKFLLDVLKDVERLLKSWRKEG